MSKCKYAMLPLAILHLGYASSTMSASSLIDVQQYRPLVSDPRAYRIGDPIVVLVVESTTAESSAGTDSSSDFSLRARAFDTIGNHEAGIGLSGSDEGEGRTARRGRAFSQLSARVAEVLPNSWLRIVGEQNLTINGENQKVVVSGVIRSEDITKDNTIISNRIADATIEIVGDGVVDDAQRQGIIFRFLKWLGLL